MHLHKTRSIYAKAKTYRDLVTGSVKKNFLCHKERGSTFECPSQNFINFKTPEPMMKYPSHLPKNLIFKVEIGFVKLFRLIYCNRDLRPKIHHSFYGEVFTKL